MKKISTRREKLWQALIVLGGVVLVAVALGSVLPGRWVATQAMAQRFQRTLTVCPEGPPACDHPTLGEAVAAANPDGLIVVRPGIYPEALVLDKSLRIVGETGGPVQVQGVEPGVPVVTLNVQGDMRVTLEGITFRASPPSGPVTENPLSCFRPEAVCSPGIVVRGTGSLSLSLMNVEVSQATASALDCAFGEDDVNLRFLHVIIERSRFTRNFQGVSWGCAGAHEGLLMIRESLIDNSSLVGVSVYTDGSGSPHRILIENSTFLANLWGLGARGSRANLTVKDSLFLQNREFGVVADLDLGSRLWVRSSRFFGNTIGLDIGGVLRANITDEEEFRALELMVEDSAFLGSEEFAISVRSGWPIQIRRSQIEQNRIGVVVARAAPWLELRENRIQKNKEWGVTLARDTCIEEGLPPIDEPITIRGEANQMGDNGRGDLCPPDYPWPEGFRTPE